jgi:hypothetical protein
MWILDIEGIKYYLFAGRKYTIGRKDDIDISIPIHGEKKNDGVSRNHAEIIIDALKEDNITNPNHTTPLLLKDLSKFGTTVNNQPVPGSISLKNGDTMTFGANPTLFKLSHFPLIFQCSKLNKFEKDEIISQLCKVDGRLVLNDDIDSFTHLICKDDSSPPTEKVGIAMISCRPIVSTQFIKQIYNRTILTDFPKEVDFPPTIDLSEWVNCSIEIMESRRRILQDLHFVFVSRESYDKYKRIIQYGGGSIDFDKELKNKWNQCLIVCPLDQKEELESKGNSTIKERDIFGLIASGNRELYCVLKEKVDPVEPPPKRIKSDTSGSIIMEFTDLIGPNGTKSFQKRNITSTSTIQHVELVE